MTGPRQPGPRQPGRPEEPWYLAYRRPGPGQPPPGRGPAPWRPPPAPAPPPAPPSNTARNLLIGVTVALFAVAGVLLVMLLGDLGGGGPTVLDVTAAQQGVRDVLTDPINGYGRDDVSGVRCNDGRNPVVRNGTGFTCTVRVDGSDRRVAVVFVDDAGTYEVDRPR